jgi:NAD+ synthase
MNAKDRIEKISLWIKDYADKNKIESLVVGVSGGIDSAVVSTLCALTGIQTFVLSMPIRQADDQHDRSVDHCLKLLERFPNVHWETIHLTKVFEQFEQLFPANNKLALANSRSRLRMTTLYQVAQEKNGIVVGTGNKVEDFGVGFYTKYGDGGVDISPIADCLKTEVWEMGKVLGVSEEIINAAPTDGLWDDQRNDEDQLGMTYPELEQAMKYAESGEKPEDAKEKQNLLKFLAIQKKAKHKMEPIPICMLEDEE